MVASIKPRCLCGAEVGFKGDRCIMCGTDEENIQIDLYEILDSPQPTTGFSIVPDIEFPTSEALELGL